MTKKQAIQILPGIKTSAKVDPSKLKILLIAPPKWGKTSFAMSVPDAVLLAFEEGHMFHSGYKMVIDCWDSSKEYEPFKDSNGTQHCSFMQAVEALEAIKGKYPMIIMDTVEMAAKLCVDFHTNKRRVEHMADAGDWGKGFDVCLNTPFRQGVLRLLKTGRGIIFICHTATEIARFSTGEVARKEARLPKGIKIFCETQADIIAHGELGKRREDSKVRDRILVLDGDADIQAGSRSNIPLPARMILPPKNSWGAFQELFTNPEASERADRIYRKHYKK